MKSPCWTPEELKLALELYLAKDMQWHSKISNNTWEIIALSELLRGLDIIKSEKTDNFRSPSSIRLKLANFKSLDERYVKFAMANIGKLDKAIWDKYNYDYCTLKAECQLIIKKYYKGVPSNNLINYSLRFNETNNISKETEKYALKLIELAKDLKSKVVTLENIDFSQKIINECNDIIKGVSGDVNQVLNSKTIKKTKRPYAGINQEKIKSDEKIGKYVKYTIQRLIRTNQLNSEIMKSMMDLEWSRNVFHLGHPFMLKVVDDNELYSQIKDHNGYVRYWKEIVVINNEKYCFCKEWYESQRKYFDKWLQELENDKKIELRQDVMVRLLLNIKSLDENNVCISVSDIKNGMKDNTSINKAIYKLLELNVLSKFRGNAREVVVEDYDLLYEMIANPEVYVKENENEDAGY